MRMDSREVFAVGSTHNYFFTTQ